MTRRFVWTCLFALLCGAALAGNVEGDIAATHEAVSSYVRRSVGTFEAYQQFTLGDPATKLYEVAVRAREAGLPAVILSLATTIATLGFFVRSWSVVVGGDAVSKRGVFVQAVFVAVLLSFSFNNAANLSVSYTALESWRGAVTWSNAKFTGAMDDKLRQSSEIMVGVLGKVAVTATAFAAPELRAVGAATAKGAGGAALKEAASKAGATMARVGTKLNFALMFMQGLIIAYANILFVSGLAVLFGVYLFPLGIALTMWGQTRVVWSIVGSVLAAWMIALTLPLVTYLSIDKVFVEPARMAAQYEAELGAVARLSGVQATLLGEQFDASVARAARECQARQEDDPGVSCLSDSGSGLLSGVWRSLSGSLNASLEVFKQTVGRFVDTIVSLALQVFYGVAYYLFSIAAMFALAGFITNVLGGAATNLGNAVKGRVMR